jgi:hypothetical protein
MTDILITAYPWMKALHIMAVIAWMAGLFYLPRLFVYHVERAGLGGKGGLHAGFLEYPDRPDARDCQSDAHADRIALRDRRDDGRAG